MKKYALILVLAAIALFALAACATNEESTQEGIHYRFENLGFYFTLPASWEGKYGLEESAWTFEDLVFHYVQVFHPATREDMESDYAGWLFSIVRHPSAIFEDGELIIGNVLPPSNIVLAYRGEWAYLLHRPTDVQWNIFAPESAAALEFREMQEDLEFIIISIGLTESE